LLYFPIRYVKESLFKRCICNNHLISRWKAPFCFYSEPLSNMPRDIGTEILWKKQSWSSFWYSASAYKHGIHISLAFIPTESTLSAYQTNSTPQPLGIKLFRVICLF
jgi:hypothetical protein